MSILSHKYYWEESIFKPENLLREAKRHKKLRDCKVPAICLLDPDGDLLEYLLRNNLTNLHTCWACFHSKLYSFRSGNVEIGILPCIVGASYAVLVAELLFVSGCELLISVTSAGIIEEPENNNSNKRFVLITSSVRDEGTSYHYLPADQPAELNEQLLQKLRNEGESPECPYFDGMSWTTDAPYRETATAIQAMKKNHVVCVEMEAAALYALSITKQYNIICFAHLTNSMAQTEGDFEKGEEYGSIATLNLVNYLLKHLRPSNS